MSWFVYCQADEGKQEAAEYVGMKVVTAEHEGVAGFDMTVSGDRWQSLRVSCGWMKNDTDNDQLIQMLHQTKTNTEIRQVKSPKVL